MHHLDTNIRLHKIVQMCHQGRSGHKTLREILQDTNKSHSLSHKQLHFDTDRPLNSHHHIVLSHMDTDTIFQSSQVRTGRFHTLDHNRLRADTRILDYTRGRKFLQNKSCCIRDRSTLMDIHILRLRGYIVHRVRMSMSSCRHVRGNLLHKPGYMSHPPNQVSIRMFRPLSCNLLHSNTNSYFYNPFRSDLLSMALHNALLSILQSKSTPL